MEFLGKSIRFVAIPIMVIVAFCLWIGFFWEPAWYVPGVFFVFMILAFFILNVYSCILSFNNYKRNKITNSQHTRKKYLRTVISITVLIFIIVSSVILSNKYKNTYDKLTRIVPVETIPSNYILTLENIDIENNSVGQDFDLEAVIDYKETTLFNGSQIILDGAYTTSFIRFQLQAIEKDSIPEVGLVDEEFTIQKMMLDGQFYLQVFVEENRGRYTGNVATVKFYFDIKREVESSEVWSHIFN